MPIEGTIAIKEEIKPLKITRESLLLGQTLYNRNCALCHGFDGSGDSLPVRRGLTRPDPLFEKELPDLYEVVTHGIGRMPAFKRKLTQSERQMVVAYVEALRLSRRFPMEKLDDSDKERVK
ncbi:c-type cytochrome [Peredibacter sp. HCB2-198]|uniref:c-type cytochrome n=1 Tax=Peredibacter sp. HCB2-198 TaxID=3383025 RepID=UPI0038B50C42